MIKPVMFACAAVVAAACGVGAQDGVADAAASGPAMDPRATAWVAPMQRLAPLVGDWDVQAFAPTTDGWEAGQSFGLSASFITGGAALLQRTQFPVDGALMEVDALFGYDQFREVYRVFAVDAEYGAPDIYQGVITDAGDLVVDNLTADTSWVSDGGSTYNFRLTWRMSAKPHEFLVEITGDQGETWSAFSRMELTPH